MMLKACCVTNITNNLFNLWYPYAVLLSTSRSGIVFCITDLIEHMVQKGLKYYEKKKSGSFTLML